MASGTTPQRELREAADRAANDARVERMALDGREPSWSLMLNPTPQMLGDYGYDTVEGMRAMMEQRRQSARETAALLARGAEDDTTITTDTEATRPSVAALLAISDRPRNDHRAVAEAPAGAKQQLPTPTRQQHTPGLEK
ncbi:hypothetical protein EF294_06460 [Gordonia oryzae]|uniref:Uncharacterized protein n=1 Tax=Gordonia oryzae TaxID=2487349 RepID=A0A3N4GPC6_9ACTN|nr:hypothetical protein [Gordonia oryzae]RPA64759.1 hypothetical protein EF294_06460 [Gordonia oryzae]